MLNTRYGLSRGGSMETKPRTAMVLDEDDELYSGFNEVAPALDTRSLKEDHAFQETLRTAGIGRKPPSRLGTGMFKPGTVGMRLNTGSRVPTAGARPMTAVRAAGYTSTARSTPSLEEKKEDSIEDKVKQMEARIMTLVEESCFYSAKPETGGRTDQDVDKTKYDIGKALAKAQEASALERQLIRMQEQANLGDTHNLDLTFSVLCNLAGQYALNEMYTEALNTYQLLTKNKLFPHANRLKVNMGNIYFKMGEHPKALKLYRMALDQTPTAEKDLRMKVMHNIGLLLVRMGKFRDAVTNFQHIMHEQGDFQTGLHLVLCSVALNDAEGGKAAFHAMLDVEAPTYHHDLPVEDEEDAYSSVMRDVLLGDRLSQWSRAASAHAERCLVLAAAALAPLLQPANTPRDDTAGMWWCVEALRGWETGGAGARLELGAALAALRAGGIKSANGVKALQRLKAVARAHPNDRVVRAEANADAAFVAYALGNYSECQQLSELACREDPYSCGARVTAALVQAKNTGDWMETAELLAAASHLDPADLIAMHDIALSLETGGGDRETAIGRWSRVRGAGVGNTLRAMAAAGMARAHHAMGDTQSAEHWYSCMGTWDVGVAEAMARLHAELGDITTAKHHYQDVEAVWPCSVSTLEWLGGDARGEPALALEYYRRAARLQPNNAQWGLLVGSCLRASGRYQEALSVYKKMNARFPENIQCLKLIVKLCGDQGLPETTAWNRELQRVQARLKQEQTSIHSAGSISSGASQSPVDQLKGRSDSAGLGNRSQLSTGSSGTPAPFARVRANTYSTDKADNDYNRSVESISNGNTKPLSRSIIKNGSASKKIDEFDDDLPLPPE